MRSASVSTEIGVQIIELPVPGDLARYLNTQAPRLSFRSLEVERSPPVARRDPPPTVNSPPPRRTDARGGRRPGRDSDDSTAGLVTAPDWTWKGHLRICLAESEAQAAVSRSKRGIQPGRTRTCDPALSHKSGPGIT
eukprot:753932-Hanusia_phi.AAC.1